jgi:hypothetical protein
MAPKDKKELSIVVNAEKAQIDSESSDQAESIFAEIRIIAIEPKGDDFSKEVLSEQNFDNLVFLECTEPRIVFVFRKVEQLGDDEDDSQLHQVDGNCLRPWRRSNLVFRD